MEKEMMVKLIPLTVENYEEIVIDRGSNQPTLEDLLHHEKIRASETLLYRIGAVTQHGRLVGFGLAVSGPWDPIQQLGHFQLEIRVDPEWRKKGIGSSIYKSLQSFAYDHGAVVLKACVGDDKPEDLSWAGKHGFVKYQHVFASQLNLVQFDSSCFSGLMEKAQMSGFNFTSLATYPQNEEWFERFIHFYQGLVKDVPGVDINNYKPEKLKVMFRNMEIWDPAGITLAVHNDQWAAMAWVTRRPDGNYYNWMTGVRRKYRGQGLGMAVKLKSIEYARNQKAEFLYTHNDSNNQPMLAINRSLGFQPTHGVFWLNRTKTDPMNVAD
jgi:GNAT superfamily N-acetyltransferase